MRLRQLQAHGFKTFANRTTFLFDEGVTAIVGPNGCGKSNIADAIRWALGEQSPSALRTKKTEDLIFSGSASRPRVGMAEVALTLENPFSLAESEPPGEISGNGSNPNAAGLDVRPRANIVDEILHARPSEVTILRRAYRSGENEYLINRQRVRLRDVQELLQRWGLARLTYAVIGQGLIDQALSLRAEERRALFEEAAGIGLYQSKKQNALDKLEETQQNLVRVNDIINEIAPRLPSLARQADRASKYESVSRALNERLSQWYAYQWARGQEGLERAAEAERVARERLTRQRAEIHDLASRLTEARRRAQVLRAKLAEHRRERTLRENERAARERELAVLEERVRAADQRREEAEREIAQLASASQARSAASGMSAEPANALAQEREVREHQRARALARKRLAEARVAEMDAGRSTVMQVAGRTDARDLAQQLVELQERLPLYEQALPAVSGLAARADALARREVGRREWDRRLERARNELNEAKTALVLAEREVQVARSAEEQAAAARKQLQEQLQAKRQRLERLADQVRDLQVQRDQAKARVESVAGVLRSMTDEAFPDEAELLESERLQTELEEQEGEARSELTRAEEFANRAVLEAERRRAEIARLEGEIEDDLGPVELDSQVPRQLRLRLEVRPAQPSPAGEEGEVAPEASERALVTLPVVESLPDNFEKEIRRLKNQMKYIGNVNPNAPQEYAELKERHAFLTEQAADLQQAIERLHQATHELDEIMKRRFKETFDAINVEFKKYFSILFGGGTARLELTEPENVIASGIEITARPPGKRAAQLVLLSGGERALTAAALLFAILRVSPTPFCVLDEVDAALDEANVGRFRDVLKELAGATQFIVITHNRLTMEGASAVYGVSMGEDGVSQVLSLALDQAAPSNAEQAVASTG